MSRAAKSLEHAAFGLFLAIAVTTGAVIVCFIAAGRASDQGENALVALADDVTRASRAQAAAERMIAVGRGYLLTREPELLARAQAADAKLVRTLLTIVSSVPQGEARSALEPLLRSAKQYRDAFAALLSGERPSHRPQEIADALRKQMIPARDELIAGLDALAAQRLGQLEASRASARERREIAISVMLAVGVSGVAASMLLLWLVVGRARELTAERSGSLAAPIRPSITGRPTAAHRMSRRTLSVRPRP
jgi:CHASE3 domain sensor protein